MWVWDGRPVDAAVRTMTRRRVSRATPANSPAPDAHSMDDGGVGTCRTARTVAQWCEPFDNPRASRKGGNRRALSLSVIS